tara:strand:+ start:128 stop:1666 length:1539 start_codon:yes stop_codon:yes gene_type:complete
MFLKKKNRMKIILLLLFCLIIFCAFYSNNEHFVEHFQKPSYINGVCYQTSFSKFPDGTEETNQFWSDIGVDKNWDGENGMSNKQISTNSGNKNVLEFLREKNVNCIRTYNATLDYPHEQFFKDLEKNELRVMYPINNYFCYGLKNDDDDDSKLKNFLKEMIGQTKIGNDYRPAIQSFAFNNEGDQRASGDSGGRYQNYPSNTWATRLVEVIDIFVNIEKEQGINSNIDIVIPLTYAGGQTHEQYKMLSDLVNNTSWKERFVLGINSFNRAETIIDEMDNHVRYEDPFYLTEFSPSPHDRNSSLFNDDLKKLWKYHNDKKKLKGVFAFSFLSQVTKEGAEKEFDITRYQDNQYNVSNCENNRNCPPQTAVIKDHNNKFEGISDAFKSYTIPSDDPSPDPTPTTKKYDCNDGNCEESSDGQYASLSECEAHCNKDPDPDPNGTICTNKDGDKVTVDFSTNACGDNLPGESNYQYLCYIKEDKNCGGQRTKDECVNAALGYWCGRSDEHKFEINM